jgi:hypothetical protein
MTVLERRGLITRGAGLEEIGRMQEKATRATVRPLHLSPRGLPV